MPRPNGRALDFFAFLPKIALLIMGKGAPVLGGFCRLPLVGPEEGSFIGDVKVSLTNTGLLMEAAETTRRKMETGKVCARMRG